MTANPSALRVEIFADGADLGTIVELCRNPLIRGFTTNPTLMRKAGVTDYERFARQAVEAVGERPIFFEVVSDDFADMERQAIRIASWGTNVYVKVPITNTRGEPSIPLVRRLVARRVQLNVTALLAPDQVRDVAAALTGDVPAYVSVFAGRIADTGRDPGPLMADALEVLRPHANVRLIWASPREVLNVVQADAIGCHVITLTPELLAKLPTLGRGLHDLSLDTVKMFHSDARAAGYRL
jgi:transaldolase